MCGRIWIWGLIFAVCLWVATRVYGFGVVKSEDPDESAVSTPETASSDAGVTASPQGTVSELPKGFQMQKLTLGSSKSASSSSGLSAAGGTGLSTASPAVQVLKTGDFKLGSARTVSSAPAPVSDLSSPQDTAASEAAAS